MTTIPLLPPWFAADLGPAAGYFGARFIKVVNFEERNDLRVVVPAEIEIAMPPGRTAGPCHRSRQLNGARLLERQLQAKGPADDLAGPRPIMPRTAPGAGDYAGPVLDLSSLDLGEIATALADQTGYEHRWLINPQTGEIVFWTSDTGIDGQTPQRRASRAQTGTGDPGQGRLPPVQSPAARGASATAARVVRLPRRPCVPPRSRVARRQLARRRRRGRALPRRAPRAQCAVTRTAVCGDRPRATSRVSITLSDGEGQGERSPSRRSARAVGLSAIIG